MFSRIEKYGSIIKNEGVNAMTKNNLHKKTIKGSQGLSPSGFVIALDCPFLICGGKE